MSSSGYLLGTFFLIFCPCCPLHGHRWTAFSIVSDRLLSYLSTNLPHLTSPSMFTNYSSIPKYHSSHTFILSRQLILMLLFLSGPIDSCCIYPRQFTWEAGQYNVPTVLSGCTFPALVFLLLNSKKFLQGTPGPV